MYSRDGNNGKVTSTFNINDKHKYIGRKIVRIDKKKFKMLWFGNEHECGTRGSELATVDRFISKLLCWYQINP